MFDNLKSGLPKKEKVPKAKSLDELYALYDYQPPAIPGHEKRVLDFQWTPEQQRDMSETLKKALDGKLNMLGTAPSERLEFPNGMYFQAHYSAKLSNVEAEIEINFFGKNKAEAASLLCRMDTTDKWGVGKEDTWILRHRLVSEKYRGQNIGSEMLKILEQGLAHIAQKEGKNQALIIEARQLGVINFALKNGFELVSKEDRENLDLVYSGDKSKVLVTTVPSIGDDRFLRHGFIYLIEDLQDRAKITRGLDLSPEEIWNSNLRSFFAKRIDEYFSEALTIRFKKEIQPLVNPHSE